MSNLEFSNEPIDIPDEMKITLWRINDGDTSPLASYSYDDHRCKWDLSAKSVKENSDTGVFCVPDEQLRLYRSSEFNSFISETKKPIFLKLEADRRNIIISNSREIAVSECNIISVLDFSGFAKLFPVFKGASYWKEFGYNWEQGYREEVEREINNINNLAKLRLLLLNHEGDIRGFMHCLRVDINIRILTGRSTFSHEERDTIRKFAYYHDLFRLNDGDDPEHGKRASDHIKRIRNHFYLNHVPEDFIEKLCFACEHHSTMLRSGDPLIDICFDADRLDLPRVGIQPDPKKMATYIGAHYAENYSAYLSEFQKIDISQL